MGLKQTSLTRCFIGLEFLAIYAASSTVSTALDNIAIGLLIAFTIYEYCKNRSETTIFPDLMFNICYWPFLILLILAALLIGYQDSMTETLKLVKFSIIAFGAFYFALQRQFHEHAIISGISLGLLTICAFSLQQFLTYPLGTRITANFAQPNNGCMMMILSVPFVVMYAAWQSQNLVFRILVGVTSVAGCIAVALTASRGGMLGLCLGALIFLLVQTFYVRKLSWHKLLSGYLAVAVAFLVIGGTYYLDFYQHPTVAQIHTVQTKDKQPLPKQEEPAAKPATPAAPEKGPAAQGKKMELSRSYDNERLLMWKSSWRMWQDHKLYGVGLWHWSQEYKAHYISPEAREPNLGFPHNIFVSFFSMTGLMGGIGYILFSVGMFIYLCHKLKQYPDDIFLNALIWSLLAVTLHGAVDVGILYRHAMILYSAYLGIGLASIAYTKRMQHQ